MEDILNLKQVCNILQVKPSTIRTWEQEFVEILEPCAPKGRSRVYSQRQLELFVQIKELLQTEQYTIKGAKRRLELDGVLTNSLGVEHNFKNTVFFMFSAIMQELQASREDSKRLSQQVEMLRKENLEIEERLREEQGKSFLEFVKTRIQGKKSCEAK
ncbi:MAG: MerR family transcriptional regulator [Thermincolia bacterium]